MRKARASDAGRRRRWTYTSRKLSEISFPLGGIGTGCIGLAGNGRLIDWEIFNRPSKGSANGFSHFAIKVESGGKVVDARVLNGDLPPPYTGSLSGSPYGQFGFGPRREYLSGMPHFREVEFRGEFPLAELNFRERRFPGQVRLRAFNPFIPLNADDSGIPAAFFEIEVKNTTRRRLTYMIAGTLGNPLPASNVNRVHQSGGVTALRLSTDGMQPEELGYGDLTLATDAEQVSAQQYWFKSEPLWFRDLEVFWQDFTAPGPLDSRMLSPQEAGNGTHGTLAARVTVRPGAKATVRFVVSWSFPNCVNYWDPEAGQRAEEAGVTPTWRNHYAVRFRDSMASADYALKEWERLYRGTSRFREALFSSSLPAAAVEAVSANLSVLKSPTAMRLEDGTFYGWEGCHPGAGCCEGTCTHVWNYAQAMPFLFPGLERSVREADFRQNQGADGGMSFRMLLPLGSGRSGFRPCADGQFGAAVKTYRDWQIGGDDEWLRSLWPAVKRSIEYAWAETNEDRWDPERTGVLHGRQHHTLDMELFGPNPWLTGFYLAALKAGAAMAEHMGEMETKAEYRTVFDRGHEWVERHLFNGEYYHQLVDLDDRSVVDRFAAADVYWDEEHGEIAYQIGQGCGVDQVAAQWHANICGLGDIFARTRVRRALRAVLKHNFKDPLRDHVNPCRVFSLNKEAGLVICDWPAGRRKPVSPVVYAQETMNGFEYAAAAHMIQEGMIEQGMKVVRAVRERYDGERRNPWNEFECGSNYARSMASYSLLLALSGFSYSAPEQRIGFTPRVSEDDFQAFFSVGSGWGRYRQRKGSGRGEASLSVEYGSLTLKELLTSVPLGRRRRAAASLGGRKLEVQARKDADGTTVAFDSPVTIEAGETLRVRLT